MVDPQNLKRLYTILHYNNNLISKATQLLHFYYIRNLMQYNEIILVRVFPCNDSLNKRWCWGIPGTDLKNAKSKVGGLM